MNRSIIGIDFDMGNEDEFIEHTLSDFSNDLHFNFDNENKQFIVYGCKTVPSPEEPLRVKRSKVDICDEVVIATTDPMYIPILRMAIVVEKDRESKTRKAVAEFFEALRLNP